MMWEENRIKKQETEQILNKHTKRQEDIEKVEVVNAACFLIVHVLDKSEGETKSW